ncbi:glycosyltransferase family 4 protein [Phreatobacter aquaticus]|uniref:Glycosyltransferase family 4 protein n=1 Tax=Phreatobacter aquaticus TaxID=2570229 RepID=A0A4D7QQU2_9HYPH|nr:glycosyltransferase family 4 protein [Phreatobacter aquaticus]QCK87614.1 glycosyltransferase family 4 protein [Phreatobacter aquaticus]
MRHILISAQFLSAGSGGIARVARLTLQALQGAAEISALSVEDREPYKIGNTHIRAFRGCRISFAVANALALRHADAAIYDFPGTARAHVLSRKPYALWVHGNEIWNEPNVRADYRRVIRKASLVLVNSRRTLEALTKAVDGLPPIVMCWLATEEEDAPPAAPIDGAPTLLFVGRSDSYFAKGQDILVRIWPRVLAEMPEARLLFVGGGEHLERLRALVDGSPAHPNIEVMGFVPESAMPRVWQRSSALALLGTLEGFGLVLVEAMRHGVPVITSTQDAASEVNIDGLTGYNIDRNDEDAVVRGIVTLLADRAKSQSMGAQGRAHWQTNFRPSVFRERLLAALSTRL